MYHYILARLQNAIALCGFSYYMSKATTHNFSLLHQTLKNDATKLSQTLDLLHQIC